MVFASFGQQIPDYCPSCQAIATVNDPALTAGQIATASPAWKKIDQPETPCLVIFAIHPDYPGVANHLGVVIGADRFIHTTEKTGSVIERLSHRWYRNKIMAFYVPNFADNHHQPV